MRRNSLRESLCIGLLVHGDFSIRYENLPRQESKMSPELENEYQELWTEYAPMDELKER